MKTFNMLIDFVVVNGKRHTLRKEVIEVTRPYAKRPDIYRTSSGDIFRAKFAKVSVKKQHNCDLVAVA